MARDRFRASRRNREAERLDANDALVHDVMDTVVPRVQGELNDRPATETTAADGGDSYDVSAPLVDDTPDANDERSSAYDYRARGNFAAPRERPASVFGTTPDRFESGRSFSDRSAYRDIGRAPRAPSRSIRSASPPTQVPPSPPSVADAPRGGDAEPNDTIAPDSPLIPEQRQAAEVRADAPAELTATDRIDDDLGPDQPLVRPAGEQVIPPSDLGKKFDDGPTSAERITDKEDRQLADAEHDDRRALRGRRAMLGIGLTGGFLGALTQSPALLGISTMIGEGASLTSTDRAAGVREDISHRRALDQAEIDRNVAARGQAAERQRADAHDALASRQAEADIGLTEARTRGEMSTQERAQVQSALDEAARAGNLEAARAGLRARISAIPDAQTRRAWESQIDSMVGAMDPDLLMQQQQRVERTDVRRGGQGPGGSGGAARVSDVDPATGLTRTRTVGGSRAPGGDPSSGRAPSSAAPITAPGDAAQEPEVSAAEAERRAQYVAMRQAVPDLTPEEFDIAAASMRRDRLSVDDMSTSPGQAAIRTIVSEYRNAPSSRQAQLLREAHGTFVRAAGGDVPLPENVTDSDYARVGPQMTHVYQDSIVHFRAARQALRQAQDAGLSEATIRAALAGSRGPGFFRNLTSAAQQHAATALMSTAARAREAYGRRLSGAAIGPGEWEAFDTQLGNHSVVASSGDFDQALRGVLGISDRHLRALAATTSSDPAQMYEYWRAKMESARQAGRGRR